MTRRQGNLLFSLPLLFVLYTFIVSEKRHLDTTRNEQKQLEAAVFVAPPASSSTTSANATSNSTRPPFKSLTDNKGNVKADVQWLLDFSIIGFAKCGTSTFMEWLHKHPELQCVQDEVCGLLYGRPKQVIRRLYMGLPEGSYKRGYKCPTDIAGNHVMEFYRTLFPKTKIFVGIRHPVRAFESLYNHRTQNYDFIPHPNKLIGPCIQGRKGTCTEKTNFALDLMRMGKTNINGPRPPTELEDTILTTWKRMWFNVTATPPIPNEVFLYETSQLADKSRQATFRRDVQHFLNLTQPMPPVVHVKPGRNYTNATIQQLKDSKKIRICDEEFVPVRNELMRLATTSSEWIRNVFLDLPGVHVSDRPHFEEIMRSWLKDPCVEES